MPSLVLKSKKATLYVDGVKFQMDENTWILDLLEKRIVRLVIYSMVYNLIIKKLFDFIFMDKL